MTPTPESTQKPDKFTLKPTQPLPYVLNPMLVGAALRQQSVRYSTDKQNPDEFRLQTTLAQVTDLFKGVEIRNGIYTRLYEYIVVENDELPGLIEKQSYQIGVAGDPGNEFHGVTVKILKKRYCGGNIFPKTLLLLTAEFPLTGMSGLTGDVILSQDGNPKGIIHPEDNARGTGHAAIEHKEDNARGTGHGSPNAVGVGLPVAVTDELFDFCFPAGVDVAIHSTGAVKVAVLDTGIVTAKTKTTAGHTCRDVQTGWDFVNNDPVPNDDHDGRHGTRISLLIRKNCPEAAIIPVKVSNADGTCELFDVLCGLEYARSIGAQVINASWSFTANPGTHITLLEQAIRRLSSAGALVVCAAGNTSQYGPATLGLDPAPHLFPACYTLDNVIAVTSVKNQPTLTVDALGQIQVKNNRQVFENHSAEFVDIGVETDAGPTHTEFAVPVFGPSRGTSFATPIMAGRVAGLLLKNPDLRTKLTVFAALQPEQDTDALADDIISGYYIRA